MRRSNVAAVGIGDGVRKLGPSTAPLRGPGSHTFSRRLGTADFCDSVNSIAVPETVRPAAGGGDGEDGRGGGGSGSGDVSSWPQPAKLITSAAAPIRRATSVCLDVQVRFSASRRRRRQTAWLTKAICEPSGDHAGAHPSYTAVHWSRIRRHLSSRAPGKRQYNGRQRRRSVARRVTRPDRATVRTRSDEASGDSSR